MKTIDRLYALFLKIVNSLQSPFLLFIRIVFGWQFLQTGIGHFTHMDKTVEFFTELHIPAPALTARFTSGLETVGGILLILGLASRLISVPLLINMTVAYLTAERDKFMAFFSDSNSFFGADAFPFFLTALIILIFGPGLFSVDTLIKRYRLKSSRSETTAAS
ncbi:MAG TPA: DoxX family protein [Candidatus Angelobacter sp.]